MLTFYELKNRFNGDIMIRQLIISLVSLLICLTVMGITLIAAPPPQPPEGELYVVQAEDWLSKIAEKYYNEASAYPLIVVATGLKANSDASFAYITNPNLLEVGQKLWIPARPPGYVLATTQAQDILAPAVELNLLGAQALAFSPDDTLLGIGGTQEIQVWDTQNWQLRWSAPQTDSIRKIAFSPDGQRVASAGFDGTAKLWEANTGQQIAQLTYGHWVFGLDFSSDSQMWATGSLDGKAVLADAVTGQPIKEFKYVLGVHDLALSPTGPWLAVMLSQDWGPGQVIVWDILTEEQRKLAEFRLWAYSNVAFSPDGQWLAAGLAGDDRVVAVWQTQTWPEVARLDVAGGVVDRLKFSPDGRLLAGLVTNFGDFEGRVWIWDVATWRLVSKIDLPDVTWDLAFSPDGRRLAVGLGQERTFEWQLWDIGAGTLEVRVPGHASVVEFSHDGRRIAIVGQGVQVWDFAGGE
jgi:WD40 repeat protein